MRTKIWEKNVTMVTKMLHVYISVMVPDRLRVAIIDRPELIYSLSSHTMTCGDPEGHKRSHT